MYSRGGWGRLGAVGELLIDRPELAELPAFVALVAHPLRWRLLQELARSDRAVWELSLIHI